MAELSVPQVIALVVAIAVSLIVLSLAATVIRAIWTERISLTHLLAESSSDTPTGSSGKASLSRFQALVFTFVIAGLYLVLSLETGTLINVPEGTLLLLGISSGTYVLGKAMSGTKPSTPAGDAATTKLAAPEKPLG